MQQVPSISTIIEVAKVCQYLYNRSIYSNKFYNGNPVDTNRPQLLYMVRKDVEWLYGKNQTDSRLQKVASYLFGLCAPFIQEALTIIGNKNASLPVVTGPTNQSVEVGEDATFSVTVVSSLPVTYQWYLNGAPVVGETASSFVISNAQVSDSGDIVSVRVSNSVGSVVSNTVTLTVTEVLLGHVYYGDTDYGTELKSGTDNVPYVFTFPITTGQPFNITFPVSIAARYIVVQYPNTEPTKTQYSIPPIDNGPVPGFPLDVASFGSNKYVFSRTGNPTTLGPTNVLQLS